MFSCHFYLHTTSQLHPKPKQRQIGMQYCTSYINTLHTILHVNTNRDVEPANKNNSTYIVHSIIKIIHKNDELIHPFRAYNRSPPQAPALGPWSGKPARQNLGRRRPREKWIGSARDSASVSQIFSLAGSQAPSWSGGNG